MHIRIQEFKKNIKKCLYKKESSEYWWSMRQKCCRGHNYISKAVYKYKYKKYLMNMCAYIPLEAKILSQPVLPHGVYGIFISSGAEIGHGCVVFQQVTIGSNTIKGSKKLGSPKLGDNCYIGAGAKIIGNVKIGNNVRIGANCVVTKDIPDNSTVVLGDCRIIEHDRELDNVFYSYSQIEEQL